MSERYSKGEDDALKSGWRGLQASGMQTGQYTEYLRGLQRVMEDAIKNGFVKSSDEVARNLTMLSHMTGNDPLWQGELGVQRLMQMNTGLAGATELQDSTDIMMMRAVRESLEAERGEGNVSTLDVLERMEQGMNADIYSRLMAIMEAHDGEGNELDIVARLRKLGINWTQSRKLYNSRDNLLPDTEYEAINTRQAGLSAYSTPELDASIDITKVRNEAIEAGQEFWRTFLDEGLKVARKEIDDTRNNRISSENAALIGDIADSMYNPLPGDTVDPWLRGWRDQMQATFDANLYSRNPNPYMQGVIGRFRSEIEPVLPNITPDHDIRNHFGEFAEAIRGGNGNRGTMRTMDEASYARAMEVLDRLLERLNNPVPIPLDVTVRDES